MFPTQSFGLLSEAFIPATFRRQLNKRENSSKLDMTVMDGYEYERKVLFPMWDKEIREREMINSKNASEENTSMRERLKNEIGLEIKKAILI